MITLDFLYSFCRAENLLNFDYKYMAVIKIVYLKKSTTSTSNNDLF
jgi:hypothetical protein